MSASVGAAADIRVRHQRADHDTTWHLEFVVDSNWSTHVHHVTCIQALFKIRCSSKPTIPYAFA